MARTDSNIGGLKRATYLSDDSLMIAEQQGEAVAVEGSLFRQFAGQVVAPQIEAAQVAANNAGASAELAAKSEENAALSESNAAESERKAEAAKKTVADLEASAVASKNAAAESERKVEAYKVAAVSAAESAGVSESKASEYAYTANIAAEAAKSSAESLSSAVDKVDNTANIALKLYGDLITETAKGELITLSNSSDMGFEELKMFGKTTQSATPTPNDPQELKSIQPKIIVTAKNILGGEALADKLCDLASATKDTETGTVSYKPANVSQKILFNKFKPDTQYTFVFYGRNSTAGSKKLNLLVDYVGGGSERLVFSQDTDSYVVYTTKAGGTVRYICGANNGGTTILYYDKCGVFEGVLTKEDFEPYTEQSISIQTEYGLNGFPVDYGGNYFDGDGQQWLCDEVDFANGDRVQRFETYTITGNEPMTISGNTVCLDVSNLLSYKLEQTAYMLCNRFGKYQKGFSSTSSAEKWISNGQFTHYYLEGYVSKKFFFKNSVFTDLATAKAWFKANNTQVLFKRTSVKKHTLSETEIAAFKALHTNRPNTSVYTPDGAYLELEFVTDTEEFINSKTSDNMFVKSVSSAWEQRMIDRIEQMVIPTVVRRKMAKAPSGYVAAGDIATGVNYSSLGTAAQGKRLVGIQIPVSTYYSAMENPASKMYTEDLYQSDGAKSTYYGINCSGFVSYACGFGEYVWTEKMASDEFDKTVLTVETEDDLFQIRRGDILLNTVESSGDGDHVRLVKDVVCDRKTGKLLGFNIAEAAKPFVTVSFKTLAQTLAMFYNDQPYRLLRLKDEQYGREVIPISYSKSVYPDNGDGGKYTSGESVWLYIPDPAATSVTVSLDGGAETTILLANMVSQTVNDVLVYEYIPTAAGTYTIYADTAASDPCTIVMQQAETASVSEYGDETQSVC